MKVKTKGVQLSLTTSRGNTLEGHHSIYLLTYLLTCFLFDYRHNLLAAKIANFAQAARTSLKQFQRIGRAICQSSVFLFDFDMLF